MKPSPADGPRPSRLTIVATALALTAGSTFADTPSGGLAPSSVFADTADMTDPAAGTAHAAEDTYGPDGAIDIPLGGSNTPAVAVNPTDLQNTAVGFFSELRVSTDGGMSFLPPVEAELFPGSDEDGDGLDGEDPVEAGVDNDLDGAIDEDPVDGEDNDADGLIDEDPAVDIDNDGDSLLNEDSDFQEIAGHPVVAFDSRGRLFWSYLVSSKVRVDSDGDGSFDTSRTLGTDIAIAEANSETGDIRAGYPVNVSASAGVNLPATGGNLHDKEWMAIDRFADSAFRDRIYLVWTQFLANGVTAVRTAYSSDQGQSWSSPRTLTAAGEGFVWPSHNAVAANGDVYVAYHCQPGTGPCGVPDGSGQVKVLRSSDGGASYLQKRIAFAAGKADITFNVQIAPRTLDGSVSWTQGSAQPWVLPDPLDPETVYVVAADDPTNTDHGSGFDDMNIMIARSTNHGVSWETPRRVDDGPEGSLQMFPSAAIDDETGCITVTYYDTRGQITNAAGNYFLDVFFRSSTDGGTTFGPETRINDLPFDPDLGAPCRFNGVPMTDNDGDGLVDEDSCDGVDNDEDGKTDEDPVDVPTLRIGEYIGIAMSHGDAQVVWTGNDATGQQILFDLAVACVAPPIADAGPDQTVECSSPDGTPVTLDGSGSSHGQGNQLTYTWEGPFGTATGQTPEVLLPLGQHIVTLTVEDAAGESSSDTVLITVEDTIPPEIRHVIADPSALWPPNHKMKDVTVIPCVVDACDPDPVCEIISIASNEPENGRGDGNTAPDHYITGALTAQLRAERAGGGNGRVYTMIMRCTDASGNYSTKPVKVVVPHDQGGNAGAWIPPGLTHPYPSSKLHSDRITFSWDEGTFYPYYCAIWIGNAPGTYDVYAGLASGRSGSMSVPGLPRDGRKLYVRLWCWVGYWYAACDYEYEAMGQPPHMLTPGPEGHLPGSSASFTWDRGSANPGYWALWIGSEPKTYDVFGNWTWGWGSSIPVHHLPTDGRRLHATLWSYDGAWTCVETRAFHASDAGPRITGPDPGSALRTSTTTFTWDRATTTPEYWALWIGSSPGTHDLHAEMTPGGTTAARVTGLPEDGRTCYVRLYYYAGGRWHHGPDTEYRAPNN